LRRAIVASCLCELSACGRACAASLFFPCSATKDHLPLFSRAARSARKSFASNQQRLGARPRGNRSRAARR
jgi:hypothetical protein